MKKQEFTRKEVIGVIEEILQYPDILIDAVQNENTDFNAEELLELAEKQAKEMKTEPIEALKLIDDTKSIVRDIEVEAVTKLFASLVCKLAFQEGQSSPKIKELEWDFYGAYYAIKTSVGHYMIIPGDEQYLENRNTCTLTYNGNLIADFDSIEETKAAAQEDFEKRVKQCLEL